MSTKKDQLKITETRPLEVWWIPQVPMKSFVVKVNNLREGKLLLTVLADYDLFQYENRIKPDYSNAGGLRVLDKDEWEDWYSSDERGIDEIEIDEL